MSTMEDDEQPVDATTTAMPDDDMASNAKAITCPPPIVREAIGLRPQPPPDGWSMIKVPGTMWAGFELDHLTLNLPLYRERKGDARERLLQWVRAQIHKLWGTKYNKDALKNPKVYKEWRKRKKSIGDWFKNHGRNEKQIKIPYWRGRVTFRSVMVIKKRAQILDLADELSGGAKRGATDGIWLGFYQKAVKQIKESLSETEKEEIREEMVQWDKTCIPEPEQARQAAERGGKTVQKVHKMLFKSMGMRCVTLCMYYDESGLPVQSIVDINDKLTKDKCGMVKSFRTWNSHKSPRAADMWMEYVTDIVIPAEKPDLLDEDVRKRIGAPKPPISIETLPKGHTLIPDAHIRENQADKTFIIRHFMNAEYKLAKAGSARSVPWQSLGADPTAFVGSKYIAEGVRLMDPEKMSGPDRTRFLEHLRRRQSMGKPALKFKQVIINGGLEVPLYPRHMERPPVAECLPVHSALPAPAGDTDLEDHATLEEDEFNIYATDYESGTSSDDDLQQLQTPAPTSPSKPTSADITRDNTEEPVPPPKKKRGRPRKITGPAPPVGPVAPKRPRGRPKKRIVSSSPERSPSASRQPSMLTPEGTPTPATQINQGPRPKPKPKIGDKAALARELRGLGVLVPGPADPVATDPNARVLRNSPLKQQTNVHP